MSGKTPTAEIQEAYSSLERAEGKLALLTQALEQGEPNTINATLTSYLTEFSQFATRLGTLQAGEEEPLLAGLVNRLERQGNELGPLAENRQRDTHIALNGAIKHVKSAIEKPNINCAAESTRSQHQGARIG